MADTGSFRDRQLAFAAHIRDPENVPAPPGIEDRRMAIYRNLFFNNLKNLLSATFPVLRKLHRDESWERMVREFMRSHRSRTPYFLELPREFLDFLAGEYESAEDDFPFLEELAHYEYAELVLAISTDEDDLDGVDPDGDMLADIPVRSVLCHVYAYHYPVHRIAPDYLPGEPSADPVFLAIRRDADDKVRFVELNPLMAELLERVEDNPGQSNGQEILEELAGRIGYADIAAFLAHGAEAFASLRANGMLLGTRKPAHRGNGENLR